MAASRKKRNKAAPPSSTPRNRGTSKVASSEPAAAASSELAPLPATLDGLADFAPVGTPGSRSTEQGSPQPAQVAASCRDARRESNRAGEGALLSALGSADAGELATLAASDAIDKIAAALTTYEAHHTTALERQRRLARQRHDFDLAQVIDKKLEELQAAVAAGREFLRSPKALAIGRESSIAAIGQPPAPPGPERGLVSPLTTGSPELDRMLADMVASEAIDELRKVRKWFGEGEQTGGDTAAAYRPASELQRTHGFSTYKKFRAFLRRHPEVRQQKRGRQRLSVHAGDCAAAIAAEEKAALLAKETAASLDDAATIAVGRRLQER